MMNRLRFFPALLAFALFSLGAHASPASGYWWNTAEPGRGFVIEIQGTTMFMAGFLYAANGEATWVASSGQMTTPTQYSGPLITYGGGQTLTGSFKAATQSASSPGNISIAFTSDTAGSVTWPEGTISIQRFDIVPGGSGATQPVTNPQTGWWWNPNEGGRGFAVEVQNGTMYLAGYMYDSAGNPLWYLASGAMGTAAFQGQWTQYANGQTLTGAFHTATLANGNVGAVTLQFADNANATLTLPDGRQIPFTRYRFGGPPTGTITEFRAGIPANAQPFMIIAGPDGNMWFTESGTSFIGHSGKDSSGNLLAVEFKTGFSANAAPKGITVGPDGNLWFTESGSDKIGRITTAGVVTEFSTGITAGAAPFSIVTGPDNNLWFTEQGGNRIGRITVTGVVTEFSTGISANAGLAAITAGIDGALWFAETNSNRIGRIDTSGAITEFSAGISAGAGPFGIAASPDGLIWFTEQAGNRIGRITTSGVVTEFSAGMSAGALPALISYNITDGTLLFAEYGLNRIGRITKAGVITEIDISGYVPSSGTLNSVAAAPDGSMWAVAVLSIDLFKYPIAPGLNFPDNSIQLSVGATPQYIAAGADGNLWFAEFLANAVGRITPSGTVTNFTAGITQVVAPPSVLAGYPYSGVWGMVKGPDGNMWFTETYANAIGRITPAGAVTEFSAGISSSAHPESITAGPDGNLWFTEQNGYRIGRITTAGVVTEFGTGITPNAILRGIASGPDGNLWFTELTANKIGRITPAGVVTEFSAGLTPGASPGDITAGPDGNMWFTESVTGKIGRITPAGVITEFSAGISVNPGLAGIVLGPDGNLWFAEATANKIGRITSAGVVAEFSNGISPGASPTRITVGPDGNLWFTESAGNAIGRITP